MEEKQLYSALQKILDEALWQASQGKGLRHVNSRLEPFEKQPIIEIARRLQGNRAAGPLYQAVKKIYESSKKNSPELAIIELLGAINYVAAAIYLFKDLIEKDV